ncbi:hypothetical protein HOLleu_20848 [Holothuria leucospilota]|uniref:Uncharacterized protein n=1 Tax=Holothuria leucospilota TaxID=206669 RepID=A0A9Q1BX34_HOLLE|nr:hypothetical protein HOLleu_20848 [Holothuria leucospilota]
MFVAKVVRSEGDSSYVAYMKQASDRELFTWPEGEELFFLHPPEDIICKLDAPEPVLVGSRLFSRFNLSTAKELFSCI